MMWLIHPFPYLNCFYTYSWGGPSLLTLELLHFSSSPLTISSSSHLLLFLSSYLRNIFPSNTNTTYTYIPFTLFFITTLAHRYGAEPGLQL